MSLRLSDKPRFQRTPQEVSVFMQVKPQICSHEERPVSDFLQLPPSLQPLLTSALYIVTAEIACVCVCVLLLVGVKVLQSVLVSNNRHTQLMVNRTSGLHS